MKSPLGLSTRAELWLQYTRRPVHSLSYRRGIQVTCVPPTELISAKISYALVFICISHYSRKNIDHGARQLKSKSESKKHRTQANDSECRRTHLVLEAFPLLTTDARQGSASIIVVASTISVAIGARAVAPHSSHALGVRLDPHARWGGDDVEVRVRKSGFREIDQSQPREAFVHVNFAGIDLVSVGE